jgi:hypothetical protein
MTTTATPAMLEAAQLLAERGYHIFPCRPGRKDPLTSNGFQAATNDERQILHWWDSHPDANIGIACGASGIVVLDIDTKHGADPNKILGGRDLAGAAIVQTGAAPAPDQSHPRSLQGARGVQVYFRGSLPTSDLPGLPGCEIRGNGAYVIAPPSLHPSGVHYGPQLPLAASMLQEVPDWLAKFAAERQAKPAGAVDTVIHKGDQHRTLVSLAGTMRNRGMNAGEIEAALLVTNKTRLEDPAPVADIKRIAQSIAKYPPGKANGAYVAAPAPKEDAEALAQLHELLDLASANIRIREARVYGKGSGAAVEIDLSNGETMTFASLGAMLRPQVLIAELAACAGTRPALKQPHCAEAMVLIKRLARYVETDTENDIARDWGRDFLECAEVLDVDMTNQAERWAAFELLARRRPWGRFGQGEQPEMPLVLRHHDGSQYVRTLWFERYVKHRDATVSRLVIGARMARVGWGRRGRYGDIKATAPGRADVRIWPFWIVPAGWLELLEAAA